MIAVPDHLLLKDISHLDVLIGSSGGRSVTVEVKVGGLKCTGKKPKISKPDEDSKQAFLVKLSHEIILHSQQRHPNIVQLLGVSLYPELTIVTEYFPLGLSVLLDDKQHKIPDWMKSKFMLDISQGLRYLHSQTKPIVHFGLTSNNILLTEHLQAKIADLATSRAFFDPSLTNLDYGSFIFMPPELFSPDDREEQRKYDVKFDVFSFGCIMIHILSQQYPIPSEQYIFSNGNEENSINQPTLEFVQVSEWKRRQSYLSHLPSGHTLLPIVEKCLANYPQDRPESSELVTDIEAGGPPSPYPLSKGGILMILEKLDEKEKQTQEAIEKRTMDHHVTTADSLDESSEGVVQLKAQVSSGLEKIAKRDKIIMTQVQRIAELEREASVTDAVVKALEDIKKKKEAEIASLTLAYKKEKNKKSSKDSDQFEEFGDAKEIIKNLHNEMAVFREEQSRNEAIMFNQQAQLESCQQSLDTARAANKSLQNKLDTLQRLQEGIHKERDELNDKYQSDVAALTELNNIHMLQRRAQDLKHDSLTKENKMLSDDLVSLKAALDDTIFRIKEQQKLTDELLRSQEQQLAVVRNVTVTPFYQQKMIIDSLMKQKLVKDDIWCLVSSHWFEKWTKFIEIALKVGIDGCNKSSHPGPVTNFTLIKFIKFQPTKMKKDFIENVDYILIPEIGWDLLVQWYGISEKSMRLSRKVVKARKHAIGKLMVEVYPITVLVQLVFPDSPDDGKIDYEVSRDDTVAFIIEKLKELLDVPATNEARLWLQHSEKKILLKLTDKMGDNKSPSSVEDNDTLILEVKKGGKWTFQDDKSKSSDKYYYMHPVNLPMSSTYDDSDYEVMC